MIFYCTVVKFTDILSLFSMTYIVTSDILLLSISVKCSKAFRKKEVYSIPVITNLF